MSSISTFNVKEELVQFLRNQDVLSISTRGVTTSTDTGTFASDSTHLIADTQIKNIRSIVVASVTLTLGTDYTYDTDFLDTTIKTKITFTSAQTGAYTITYDTGPDKIFPDFPKDSLSISSYPRIAVDTISMASDLLGYGNQQVASSTNIFFTIVVYANKSKTISQTLDLVRSALLTAQNSFVNLSIITPTDSGPLINDNTTKNEILHQNMDFVSQLNVEKQ